MKQKRKLVGLQAKKPLLTAAIVAGVAIAAAAQSQASETTVLDKSGKTSVSSKAAVPGQNDFITQEGKQLSEPAILPAKPAAPSGKEGTNQTSAEGTTAANPLPAPGPEKPSRTGLYLGLGAGAALLVGIAAGASGGGGSDDSSTTTTTTPSSSSSTTSSSSSTTCTPTTPVNNNPLSHVDDDPTVTPVCASFSGSWSGALDLVGDVAIGVTATVKQNGEKIEITTTSSKNYGKSFIGTVSDSCNMKLYDQTTGELWTTHHGAVSANRIDVYDYVGIECWGYTKEDRLTLTR